MFRTAHVMLVASLVAAGCVLVRAASITTRSGVSEPTVLAVVPEAALEELAASSWEEDVLEATASAESSGSGSATPMSSGLFANNKIHIRDSRIVLTARDRTQLLQSIARAMVADQKKMLASASSAATSPLVPITRDAFLYLVPSGRAAGEPLVVRLGWRYPLAAWPTYKVFVTTQGCDVQRAIGDYFYC